MTANLHGTVLNFDESTLDEASNYSVSATSFTDVDGTHLALQLTVDPRASTGQALIGWHGNVAVPVGQKGYFNLLVNGTLNAANDGIIFSPEGTLGASFTRLVTDLVVGTLNTVKLQAKVSAGTMTIYSGAGTSTLDTHGQFWGVIL
jgi:hypothetical protein